MSEQAKQAKQVVVDEIMGKVNRAQSVVFVDYRGLTVEEDTNLRNELRKANVEYRVLKNSLLSRAMDSMEISGLEPTLEGPTAVAFSYDDPVAAAKILGDFVKKAKKGQIKAGIVGKSVVDAKGVEALAALPSKEVLVAKLLGTLNAPMSNFVGVLNGPARALCCALKAISEQKEA